MNPVPPNCVKGSIEQLENSDRQLISSGSSPIINMGSQIGKKNGFEKSVLPSEDESLSRLWRKSLRERLSLNDCCLSPCKEKMENRNLPTKKNSFRWMVSSPNIAKIGEKSDELVEQLEMKNPDESGHRDSGYNQISSGNDHSWSPFSTVNSSFRRSPGDENRIKGGNHDSGHERELISINGEDFSCRSFPTAESSFRRSPGAERSERRRKDSAQNFEEEDAAKRAVKKSLSFSPVKSGKQTKSSSPSSLPRDIYKSEEHLSMEKSEKDFVMKAEPNSYNKKEHSCERQLIILPTTSKLISSFYFLFNEENVLSSSEIPAKDQHHVQDSLKLEILLKPSSKRKTKDPARRYHPLKLEKVAGDFLLDLSSLDFALKSAPQQNKRARYQVFQKRGIPFFYPDLETILEETDDSESCDDEFEILNSSSNN